MTVENPTACASRHTCQHVMELHECAHEACQAGERWRKRFQELTGRLRVLVIGQRDVMAAEIEHAIFEAERSH